MPRDNYNRDTYESPADLFAQIRQSMREMGLDTTPLEDGIELHGTAASLMHSEFGIVVKALCADEIYVDV